MDPTLNPYSFWGMGTGSDPFNYYSSPGYSTQFASPSYAPTGDLTVAPENYPLQEAMAEPQSMSQVPGTSGAPSYMPSATPGGVSAGAGARSAGRRHRLRHELWGKQVSVERRVVRPSGAPGGRRSYMSIADMAELITFMTKWGNENGVEFATDKGVIWE